eukprot:TRINITY_DN72592_c0_g1_i1.p1 TRINITY_DN72592_c0_g1~~TRINITY_DN72592_c0_g1_i1.p1  ORF type:complete len:343 (-),score=83.58 TRINITY_DN72592_c0_g1_i1:140-1168(-)
MTLLALTLLAARRIVSLAVLLLLLHSGNTVRDFSFQVRDREALQSARVLPGGTQSKLYDWEVGKSYTCTKKYPLRPSRKKYCVLSVDNVMQVLEKKVKLHFKPMENCMTNDQFEHMNLCAIEEGRGKSFSYEQRVPMSRDCFCVANKKRKLWGGESIQIWQAVQDADACMRLSVQKSSKRSPLKCTRGQNAGNKTEEEIEQEAERVADDLIERASSFNDGEIEEFSDDEDEEEAEDLPEGEYKADSDDEREILRRQSSKMSFNSRVSMEAKAIDQFVMEMEQELIDLEGAERQVEAEKRIATFCSHRDYKTSNSRDRCCMQACTRSTAVSPSCTAKCVRNRE